jgi:hypothetical protein
MRAMSASADDSTPHGDAGSAARSSPWAPFRSPDFARMASAQFVSNVGGWMQTVGAQELMLTLTTSSTLVALIQPRNTKARVRDSRYAADGRAVCRWPALRRRAAQRRGCRLLNRRAARSKLGFVGRLAARRGP